MTSSSQYGERRALRGATASQCRRPALQQESMLLRLGLYRLTPSDDRVDFDAAASDHAHLRGR